MVALPLFTVGHSNREFDEFLTLLQLSRIELLVDVRRLPGSKRYPQFNADTLGAALAEHSIEYTWNAALTGRRPVSADIPFETNAWWQNRSFHNYADYALTREFRDGLGELLIAGAAHRTAVMCSEAVWWRCHRRIIADYLLVAGLRVGHILGRGQVVDAELSAGAVLGDDGRITYPVAAPCSIVTTESLTGG